MGLFELFYFEISFCLGERQLWDCGCCELANQGIVKLDCLLKKKRNWMWYSPLCFFNGDIKVILDSFAIALNRLWTLLSSTTNILTRSTGVEQRGNPSGEPFLHHLSNTNQHKVNIHSFYSYLFWYTNYCEYVSSSCWLGRSSSSSPTTWLHELSISGLGSTTILGLGLGYTVKVHTKIFSHVSWMTSKVDVNRGITDYY